MIKILINFYSLLDKNFKSFLIILTIFLLLGMIIETIGVSLIIPLVSLVIFEGEYINYFSNLIGINLLYYQKSYLINFFVIIFAVFFLLKSIYLVSILYLHNKFSFELQASLSYNLYKNYLKKSFQFHTNQNSSILLRNIIIEMNNLHLYIINPLITLFAECLLVLGIMILMMLVDIRAFILIIFISVPFIFIYLSFAKKKIKFFGEKRLHYDGLKLKNAKEAFNSIKEIKVYNAENYSVNNYDILNRKSANYAKLQHWFEQFPRILLELFAVGCILIFLLYIGNNYNNIETLIAKTSLFALASFKILPSLNKILVSIQNFKYGIPFLEQVASDLDKKEKINKKHNTNQLNQVLDTIEFKDVSFKYTENLILNKINFKFTKGDIVGIKGPSGSGKTTMLNLITGLLEPSKGKIIINDELLNKNQNKITNNIGYVPQNIFLNDDTILKNIAFGVEENKINLDKVKKLIDSLHLKKVITNLPNKINYKIGENAAKISGGEKQRIGIARALYFEPDLIILDEATNELDETTEKLILNTIQTYSKTKISIIISHKESTLKICNKILNLNKGQLN